MSYRGTSDWQDPLRTWTTRKLPHWVYGLGGFVVGFNAAALLWAFD
jgi:hypothetical protein